MNVKKYNLLILILLAMTAAAPAAETLSAWIQNGNQLYQQEDYSKALAQYDQAQSETGENEILKYNRANCFYKLEDYTQAINLYREISAEAKDMDLVARAKYNLGNCHYQEGMKQRDSDLQKALDELTTSISYYRAALDMNEDDEQAKHNIAVVRLIIKDILDQLQKQKEEEEKNKPLPEKIKELLKRQVEQLAQTTMLQNYIDDPNAPAVDAEGHFQNQSDQQSRLKNDTTAVREEAQQLQEQAASGNLPAPMHPGGAAPPTPPGTTGPATPGTTPPGATPPGTTAQPTPEQIEQMKQIYQTVTQELSNAVDAQDNAAGHLQNQKGKPAIEMETEAAESLKRALEAFGDPNQPQDQQQQNQDQNQQQQDQQQDQQQQQQDQQQDQPQDQPQDQQQDQQQAPDATAREILDREKDLKDRRRRQGRTGYRPVDRDW